jgi:hypothetical protein
MRRNPERRKLMEDLLLGQIMEDADQSRQIGCDPSFFWKWCAITGLSKHAAGLFSIRR